MFSISRRRALLPPRRLRLPLLCAAALVLAASASAADPVRSPPPACVVSAGARSFDLAELGGGGSGAAGAPPLRHVSRAADSLGWTYSFAACGNVAPLPAACAGAAPGSAALQQTAGACYGLGASVTRSVAATATGVELSFSGGDGGRSSVVTVECADVAQPQVVRWGSGAAPGSYTALVRARAGCALECARDAATGAMCGGKGRGLCVADDADDRANCVCSEGHAGADCAEVKRGPQDSSVAGALSFATFCLGILILNGIVFVVVGICASSSGSSSSSVKQHDQKSMLSLLATAVLCFLAGFAASYLSPPTALPSFLMKSQASSETFSLNQNTTPSLLLTPPREAYIVYASGSRRYFELAFACILAIRKVDTAREVILLYTNEIDTDLSAAFAHAQVRVETRKLSEEVTSELSSKLDIPTKCGGWGGCWIKFFLFSLVEFDNVVYIDSDVLLMRPINLAFSVRDSYTIAAVEDPVQVFGYPTGKHNCFNTGLFGARPSRAVYEDLISFAEETDWNTNIADQGLLNLFFEAKGSWLRLPSLYNIYPYLFETMVMRIGVFPFQWPSVTFDRVHGLHFTWLSKFSTDIKEEACKQHVEHFKDSLPSCIVWAKAQKEAREFLRQFQ
jgi:alpha-N-acetylglucosamine transferase